MTSNNIGIIVIGGSWGGFQASLELLEDLPASFPIPVILVLHRIKNAKSAIEEIYNSKIFLKVKEVEEKEAIQKGYVYIAPANYHVLVENDRTFSLDMSEPVHYSRPSIDVTFLSAANVYGKSCLGILLSGANKDGSYGLNTIAEKGGIAIVQDPQEAEVSIMPQSAIDIVKDCKILRLNQISNYLVALQSDL